MHNEFFFNWLLFSPLIQARKESEERTRGFFSETLLSTDEVQNVINCLTAVEILRRAHSASSKEKHQIESFRLVC